jgi:4a-hydroxytetrahydrobiopterin dehydratase
MAPHSTPTRTPCPQRASVSLTLAPLSARLVAVMSDLATKTCVPCRGGVPPLKGEELGSLQKQVDGWNVVEEHHVTKTFTFPNFREALKFVNQVGELAEEQGHHPDIFVAWGKVEITAWTHKINGLTESDFILAAKIDQLATAITDEKFRDFQKLMHVVKEAPPQTGSK